MVMNVLFLAVRTQQDGRNPTDDKCQCTDEQNRREIDGRHGKYSRKVTGGTAPGEL